VSERQGFQPVQPRKVENWRAVHIALDMDVNALQDVLAGHAHWQIMLDPNKGAAVLINGFRGVTGDWVLVDGEGVASIVKAADFKQGWETSRAVGVMCPDCAHRWDQHSPAGCWHMDGVIRCACATQGDLPTEVARSNSRCLGLSSR